MRLMVAWEFEVTFRKTSVVRLASAIRSRKRGTLGGGSGLGVANEQFLLTREAFGDAWNRLSPDD